VKKMQQTDKMCGVLRVSCGVCFDETPQDNALSNSALWRLRGFAGFLLCPYARARAHAHAHARTCVRAVGEKTPQDPARGLNSLSESGLTCGVWAPGDPAKTPQKVTGDPANGRRPGEGWRVPVGYPHLRHLSGYHGGAAALKAVSCVVAGVAVRVLSAARVLMVRLEGRPS
jgi:hypothetical protein